MIFVHSNGKVNVQCRMRCGHSSMYGYFGVPLYSQADIPPPERMRQWLSNPGHRVLVIRHPVERLISAIRHSQTLVRLANKYDSGSYKEKAEIIESIKNSPALMGQKATQLELLNPSTRQHVLDSYTFAFHAGLYLQNMMDIDFKYIPFSRIGEYINIRVESGRTDTKNRVINDLPLNPFISRIALEKEVLCYEELCRTREMMAVREWRKLTEVERKEAEIRKNTWSHHDYYQIGSIKEAADNLFKDRYNNRISDSNDKY